MNNFNPYFNSINMTRNISPFATTGSSIMSGATQVAKTGGLFSRIGSSKITLSGILNGAQKTIGTVNQIVPLYNQIKPMFQNSKILLSVAKGLKSDKSNNNSKGLFKNRKRNYYYAPESHQTINTEEAPKKEKKQKENQPSKPFFA